MWCLLLYVLSCGFRCVLFARLCLLFVVRCLLLDLLVLVVRGVLVVCGVLMYHSLLVPRCVCNVSFCFSLCVMCYVSFVVGCSRLGCCSLFVVRCVLFVVCCPLLVS